jgi:5'-phosphate synthase pdxT subunit
MGKLMIEYGLAQPLRHAIDSGMPTWGTCAGLILLSRATDNAMTDQPLLAAMDIRTRRNAFGPQRASFETDLAIPVLGAEPVHAVFIRAPLVEEVGAGVEVLGRLVDEGAAGIDRALEDSDKGATIVAVRQGNLMGTAFHPEVTQDLRFHDYFLQLTRGALG